jgi:hypothetical protein
MPSAFEVDTYASSVDALVQSEWHYIEHAIVASEEVAERARTRELVPGRARYGPIRKRHSQRLS